MFDDNTREIKYRQGKAYCKILRWIIDTCWTKDYFPPWFCCKFMANPKLMMMTTTTMTHKSHVKLLQRNENKTEREVSFTSDLVAPPIIKTKMRCPIFLKLDALLKIDSPEPLQWKKELSRSICGSFFWRLYDSCCDHNCLCKRSYGIIDWYYIDYMHKNSKKLLKL